jgi:hypothetical protein
MFDSAGSELAESMPIGCPRSEPHGRKKCTIAFEFDYRLDCLRGRSASLLRNRDRQIGFSSFSGFYGPLWLAVEDRLGRKYGLDLI